MSSYASKARTEKPSARSGHLQDEAAMLSDERSLNNDYLSEEEETKEQLRGQPDSSAYALQRMHRDFESKSNKMRMDLQSLKEAICTPSTTTILSQRRKDRTDSNQK